MTSTVLPPDIRNTVLRAQKLEITEYHIYEKLSRKVKDPNNAAVLARIALDEKRHAEYWARYSGVKVEPLRFRAFYFFWLARLFGLTFALKLLERGEKSAKINYDALTVYLPEAKQIAEDEDRHEKELLGLINEESLQYIGSIVLGLNDALVELTGALAGLSFAFQNSHAIGFAGVVTGIAAGFSMAASDYLSTKAEGHKDRALRSAAYTGIAYLITVALLAAPYLLGLHFLVSLVLTLAIAIIIIALFNYYISVATDQPFAKRFLEMTFISLGVASFTFVIGIVAREVFHISL